MKKIFCIVFLLAAFNLNNLAVAKKKDFPKISLKSQSRASLALDIEKNKLPELAEWYGYSVNDFTKLLKQDKTLRLDTRARLFVADDAPDFGLVTSFLENPSALNTSIPLAETFFLHSNPGSSKVIYLDFNGHIIPANSAWADSYNNGAEIHAPAFSTDADLDNFSNSELQIIQDVWRLVAEDFAAFDVDVTTEEPPESALLRDSFFDNNFGSRVLISPISSYFGDYGGLAYVGVFDNIGDYYQPALAFTDKVGNTAKNIGEVASHEVGHNLGLNHDGTSDGDAYYTGHGDWAPIMGSAYSKSVTQWSNAEYANANNTQDDLLVMEEYGLSLKNDDHENSIESASTLNINAGDVSQNGFIHHRDDVDYFVFETKAGPIDLYISPAQYSPNLDILASLYDSSGNLILSSDPEGMSANLSARLDPGTYYISVDGTGSADPLDTGYSDYSSLGSYSITGNIFGAKNSTHINPPTNLTASFLTRETVVLDWFDESTNETGFVIERAVKMKGKRRSPFTEIARTAANIITYTDTVSANTYIYRVRAINANNETSSNYSNKARIRLR